MKIPVSLKKGDKVGVVCTARSIEIEKLEFAFDTLKKWDLEPVIGKSVGAVHDQYAGTDKLRADDFQSMLDDNDIKAIICAKGGYGTVRMIDFIDFNRFKKRPKWITGFSDITVLHAHIQQNFKIATLHSPLLSTFKRNCDIALDTMRQTLFGEIVSIKNAAHKLNRTGKATGKLVGGNLSVLYSLLGSKSDLETDGFLLFLEDLDEYLYHIDRMVVNLKRAGKFKNIKGLLVGGMTSMNDNDTPFGKTCEEIISEHVSDYDFPVCFNFPTGHIEHNHTVILGGKYELDVTEDSTLLKKE